MMALQDNAAKSSTTGSPSVNHPAQHRGAPAHHHGAHGKTAKHGHGHGHSQSRSPNTMEQKMATHKKDDDGAGQTGYGRPC